MKNNKELLLERLAELTSDRNNYEVFSKDYYEIQDFLEENPENVEDLEFIHKDFEDISDSYDFTDELFRYVVKFKEEFYRLTFRNTSYSGLDFKSIEEVEQKQKTITYYEKVK